jgi:DNA invertase Pin-like site-specific DNA recombinase
MVVCYLRTANSGSAGQRLLDRQHAKLEREAAARGWTVTAWVEDLHQSGATLHRPGLREALALLADHQADALLATDPDRLAITPEAADQLTAIADRQGWQLLTVETLALHQDRRSP